MKSQKQKTTHTSGKCNNDKSSGIIDCITVKIRENPCNALAYFARAREEKRRGNTRSAIRDYTLGLQYDTLNATAFYNRGLLYMQESDYKSAIADLTHAIAIDPKLWNAYLNRADSYKFAGNYDLAIIDYTAVIYVFPDCVIAWMGRRDARILQKDLQGAAGCGIPFLDDGQIGRHRLEEGEERTHQTARRPISLRSWSMVAVPR